MIVLYWPAILLAILGIVYPAISILIYPIYRAAGGRLSFKEYWRTV